VDNICTWQHTCPEPQLFTNNTLWGGGNHLGASSVYSKAKVSLQTGNLSCKHTIFLDETPSSGSANCTEVIDQFSEVEKSCLSKVVAFTAKTLGSGGFYQSGSHQIYLNTSIPKPENASNCRAEGMTLKCDVPCQEFVNDTDQQVDPGLIGGGLSGGRLQQGVSKPKK
jgi:hypothetical protein